MIVGRGATWLMDLDFRRAIWIAPLVWTLHEAEEWDIISWGRTHFADPGYFSEVDQPVVWIGLGLVALTGILWTCLTAWPRNPKYAAFLTLPFFVFFAFGNVLQHLYYAFFFSGYNPGLVTAILLVMPVLIGLTIKAVRDRLIPVWFAAVLYVLTIPSMAVTVRALDHVPPQVPPNIQSVHRIALPIARLVLGRHD
jgi:hypothetical protein